MSKVIVLSHGSFADGLYNTLKLFVANPEHIQVLGLDEDLALFQKKVRFMILDNPGQDILILVDIFGGTPFNTVAALVNEAKMKNKNLEVITGVSLPMLLEVALNQGHSSLQELKLLAVKAGRLGVRDLFSEINQKEVIGE